MSNFTGRTNLLIILIFLTVSWISSVQTQVQCTTYQDCLVHEEYGEFSKCKDGVCHCVDYFTLGLRNCINVVPHGEACTEQNQCKAGPMGQYAQCNRTTSLCECANPTPDVTEMVLLNGKCTQVRKIDDICIENGECIAGSNEYAICSNETGKCGCLSNDIVMFVPNKEGICVLDPGCGDRVDISVFAATIAGSVALLVFIVIIYRLTNPNRMIHTQQKFRNKPKEIQRHPSIQPVLLPSNSTSTTELVNP